MRKASFSAGGNSLPRATAKQQTLLNRLAKVTPVLLASNFGKAFSVSGQHFLAAAPTSELRPHLRVAESVARRNQKLRSHPGFSTVGCSLVVRKYGHRPMIAPPGCDALPTVDATMFQR
jgi:hypothetical protein